LEKFCRDLVKYLRDDPDGSATTLCGLLVSSWHDCKADELAPASTLRNRLLRKFVEERGFRKRFPKMDLRAFDKHQLIAQIQDEMRKEPPILRSADLDEVMLVMPEIDRESSGGIARWMYIRYPSGGVLNPEDPRMTPRRRALIFYLTIRAVLMIEG